MSLIPLLCGPHQAVDAMSALVEDQIEGSLKTLVADASRPDLYEEAIDSFTGSLKEQDGILLLGFEQEDPWFLKAYELMENALGSERLFAVCGANLAAIRSAMIFADQSDTLEELARRIQAEARASIRLI